MDLFVYLCIYLFIYVYLFDNYWLLLCVIYVFIYLSISVFVLDPHLEARRQQEKAAVRSRSPGILPQPGDKGF